MTIKIQKIDMKKTVILLATATLLTGCVESVALLGPITSGAGSGKVAQSAVSSAVSFGVKSQTGRSPSQHALAYVNKHNPENKKERCIKFLKSTNTVGCAIANKKFNGAKTKVIKVLSDKKKSFKQQFALARKTGKDYFVFKNKIYNTSFKKKNNPKKLFKVENSILRNSKIEDLAKKSDLIQR